MMAIEDHIRSNGWTQQEAAQKLHVTHQPHKFSLKTAKAKLIAVAGENHAFGTPLLTLNPNSEPCSESV